MRIDRGSVGDLQLPLVLILALLAAPGQAQSAPEAPGGEEVPGGQPKPGEKLAGEKKEEPKLQIQAWIAYGDKSDYGFPSGFSVPVTVHVDNPDAGFTGRLVLECRVFLDEGAGFGDEGRGITVETTRPMEIETSQQRQFTITGLLPERGTLDQCRVWLYPDTAPPVDTLVSQAPVLLGPSSLTLLVLAEDRKLFSEEDQLSPEDRLMAEVDRRSPWAVQDPTVLEDMELFGTGSRLFQVFYADGETLPPLASILTPLRAVMLYQRAADPNNFSSAHLEAIADYVMSGGNLIVVPGSVPELYAQPPLRDMLPVYGAEAVNDLVLTRSLLPQDLRRRTDLKPVPGLRLPQFQAGHEREGEYIVAEGARVLLEGQDRDPLVVKSSYGLGHVYWFAYDISNRFVSYETLSRLRRWLDEDRDSSVRRYLESLRKVDVEKEGFKLEAPPRAEILRFLGFYILLLVPANYLVFSFLGRRELAWIVVPVLAIGFAYYYYASGFLTRLGFLSTYQHGAVIMMPGAADATVTRTRILGTLGLYSPNNDSSIQVSFDNPDIGFGLDIDDVREMGTRQLQQKFREDVGGRTLENLSIKAKAARALRFDGYVDVPGCIQCAVQEDELGRYRVVLTNRLVGMTIHGRSRIVQDEFGKQQEVQELPRLEVFRGARDESPLGPELGVESLAPGESVEVVVDPREYEGADDLSILLTGELREPLLEPTINGQKRPSTGARYRIFMRVW